MATLEQQKKFIAEVAPYAVEAYKVIGKVKPSVCIGMACVESGYGTSKLMYNHHAVLGQKVGTGRTATKYWPKTFFTSKTSEEYTVGVHTVIQAAFRSYVDLRQCIFNYYELLNTSLYKNVKSNADYKTQMQQIKACGYMTSSTEVNSVLNVIKAHDLTRYDGEHDATTNPEYLPGKTYTLLSDLYVRDKADGTKVKYDALTQDAKLHAKYDDYGCAILLKGTKVTCKSVVSLKTSTWIKIPSGWICAKNKTSTYIK